MEGLLPHLPEPTVSPSCPEPAHVPPDFSVSEIDIVIATANVLTMNPATQHQTGTSLSRQNLLMQQFHDAGCFVVGVQETRHKHLVGTNNCWYHILGHPASPHGQDGIQLWISASIAPIKDGQPIRQDQIRLVSSDYNYIVAKFITPTWRSVIITCRAPHSGRPLDEGKAFWQNLTNILHRKATGWPIIFCGDANAHLGECTTTAVGPLASASENQAGTLFHDWLLAHHLFLPATFASTHPGEQHCTFWSPASDHHTRIDYIAVPVENNFVSATNRVADDIDLSVHRIDHHAVLCRYVFRTFARVLTQEPRPRLWDSQHLVHNLQHEDVLIDLSRKITPSPWHEDPHTSAVALAQQTTQALHSVARPRLSWKRKCHISEQTWLLVEQKKMLFRQLKALRRTLKFTTLQACFQGWRSTSSASPPCIAFISLLSDLSCWLRLHDKATAQTAWKYHQIASQVCQAIRTEDATYYQSLAEQSARTYSVEGLTGLWKHLRAILPKNRNKRNNIQHDLGDSLLHHFEDLEAGLTLSQQELYNQCLQRNARELVRHPRVQQFALAELPTLAEIEDHCLRQRPHKAPGPDGIPSTLCRSGAVAVAPSLHTLVLKSFLCGLEPFIHKGGYLCTIFKHKGARDDAAAYRGILLTDAYAKITHAWTRMKLLPTLQERRTIGQLGGLPAQQTLTGIQVLRVHGKVCKAAKLSSCTLFLDLRSAFHHLLRELVFVKSDGLQPEDLATVFDPNHFDLDNLFCQTQKLKADERNDLAPGLKQFLHDIHHQTWFQFRGAACSQDPSCTHTRRGSRPGSPLADIAFNLMLADFLRTLQKALLDLPSFSAGCNALGVHTPPIAWMDDIAIPIATVTPDELVPLTKQVLALVHGLFRDRGLTLNLDAGKTEAVLCFRGTGATAHRSALFDRDRLPVLVVETESHILSLRVVPTYKHLGAKFTMGLDINKEVNARLGSARQAFEEMKHTIYLNKRLPLAARLQLFQSLILSRLFYGCAVWSDVPTTTVKRIDSALMSYYRRIHNIGYWNGHHISDADLLRSHQLPSFRLLWAQHKLTFLQHVAQHGPVFHKALLFRELEAGSGWLFELQSDLEWLARFQPALATIPTQRDQWTDLWKQLRQGAPWKSWIRRAVRRHLLQEKVAWEVETYHAAILNELRATGFALVSDCSDPSPQAFACTHCDATFPSHQQRALHEFRVHQIIAEERYYVQSTVCGGCLKDFHTTYRVTQHLRYRPNLCWNRLQGTRAPAEPVNIGLPVHLREVPRLPAVRRHSGPLRPTLHHCRRRRVRQAIQDLHAEGEPDFAWWDPRDRPDLLDRCTKAFQHALHQWANDPEPTEVDFHNRFFMLFANLDIPEFQAARIFIFWIEHDFQDDREALSFDHYEVLERAHLSLLEDIYIWQLRQRMNHLQQIWDRLEQGEPLVERVVQPPSHPHDRRHDIVATFYDLEAQETLRRSWCALHNPVPVPLKGDHPLYIVHLYSGRRRTGDFHFHMQQFLTAGHANFSRSILVLSIDTAINDSMNVHCEHLWHFLLDLARQGQIAALLLGPPCETWSSARFAARTDTDGNPVKGPRPLRGDMTCWGLPGLSHRELLQVSVGNSLLLKGLQLCVPVAAKGGAVVLEHPAPPLQQEHPSIWRTGIVRLLSGRCKFLRQYTFQQWRHGAAGIKPTTLLFANAEIPRAFIDRERRDLPRPTAHLIGTDNQGQFRTSYAKEYPEGMCLCLAAAFWDKIHRTFGSLDDLSSAFPPLARELAAMAACVDRGTMRPDYQPQ